MIAAVLKLRWRLALAIYALVGVQPVGAHSGEVALAYPVSGIAVDGDLADWPDYLPRYPIARKEYGVAPDDSLDHRAFFRVAYDSSAQHIYAAFEVWDQSTVIDTSATANWLSTDCSELYVHADHADPQAPMYQFEMGGRLLIGNPDHARVAMRRRDNFRSYEWRLDARGVLRPGQKLRPGLVLGIDPVVIDIDADGSHSWMAWSRGPRKFNTFSRLGDIVLAGPRHTAGELRVRCTWTDDGAGVRRAWLRLTDSDGQSIEVETDDRGVADLDLPAGRYQLQARASNLAPEQYSLALAPGDRASIDMAFAPVGGRQVPAGAGVRTAAGAGARSGAWHTFGLVDGLPHTILTYLYQDRLGYLWIGTEVGLVRYDGQSFLRFSAADGLPSDRVTAITEDRRGHLWISTWDGIARYDGRTFTSFTQADGLPDNLAGRIMEVDGEIWVTSRRGLSRFDGRRFATLTTDDGLVSHDVGTMVRDRRGRVWIAGDGGVSRYDGHRFDNIWRWNPVSGIIGRSDGVLWTAETWGVFAFGDDDLEPVPVPPEFAGPWSVHLIEDSRGDLWISRLDDLVRYDGRTLDIMGVADGLPHRIAKALLVDREGSLWVATSGGLSRYDGGNFSYYDERQALPDNTVKGFLEDRDGRVWVATAAGVSVFDDSTWTPWTPGRGFENHQVYTLLEDSRGRIWAGRVGGVSVFDEGGWTHYLDGEKGANNIVPDRNVVDALEDRRGRIWLATWDGLLVYDGEGFTRLSVEDGLSNHTVNCILEDRNGHIWAGTGNGLNRYDGERFTHYSVADGLLHQGIDVLYEDRQGRIWIGTQVGMNVWEDGRISALGLGTEMGRLAVLDIAADEKGRMWIGTNDGAVVYDGVVMQNLLRRDGLPDPTAGALLVDRRGRVWIGSDQSGATVYAPQDVAPNIVLQDVVTNSRLGPVARVALPTSQPLVAFEYLGLSFKTRTDALLYRYRLKGHEDWRTTRAQRVEYRDLPRGDYVFEVQAIDRDLNYSDETLAVAVRVHPPYRQIALYGTLSLALVLLVASVERILRSRRELELRVDERTAELAVVTQKAEAANQAKSVFLANMSHEIRTPLNAVLGYAQVLKLRRDADPELKTALDAIDQGGLHLLDLINNVLDLSKIEAARAELDAVHFDLGLLVQSLDALFRNQCQRKGLQLWVRWRRDGQALAGPPRAVGVHGDEGKLRQVLINLLGNAVKFTDRGEVSFSISLPREGVNLYSFAVADTGPGIDAEAQQAIFEPFARVKEETRVGGTGLGLAIASRHVELMGGRLRVESVPGEGSLFHFDLPLADADAPPQAHSSGSPRIDAGRFRALVAEDATEIQGFMRQLLERAGMRVEIVADGRAAVDRALADAPDIIFMDIWMPVLDGMAAARRITEALGEDRPKLVAVTASALEHERQKYRADFDEVILKPVRVEEIYRALGQLLDLDLVREEPAPAAGDFAGVDLPPALYRGLREAVEYGLITELKEHLADVRALGAEGAALAARIEALSRRFAKDEIQRILDQVKPREG